MNCWKRFFWLLCCLFALIGQGFAASGNGDAVANLQARIQEIYQKNRSAVVTVYAVHNPPSPEGRPAHFVGTGFYISREGHIITNTNIIHGADRVWVEREGVGYLAETVGSDRLTNIAILKAMALPDDFTYLRFSNHEQLPAIGSFAIALTSELGMPPGPDMGLINGWNTSYGERILPTIYLRSTLPLEGGEGGAPVFDLNGALIGIGVASLPEIGGSFILPARAVERIRDDILFSGQVTFAHFGFTTLQVPNLQQGPSVVIEELDADGPAAQAGMLPGDVLISVGGTPIRTDTDLRMAFFFTRPEERVSVEVKRGEERLTLAVMVGRQETPPAAMPDIRPGAATVSTESAAAPRPELQPREADAAPPSPPAGEASVPQD